VAKLFGGFRTRQDQLDSMERKALGEPSRVRPKGITRKPAIMPKRKAPVRKMNMGPPTVSPIPGPRAKPKMQKKRMSLDEINARIKALQKEIDADKVKRQKSMDLLNRKHR